mmetsp:Transcript_5204/g.12951  ORF Transcript_5204/g.12951 Transcript_5204/m.12951 type:complete len:138 (-) Transcript_5204:53-466(-)
MRGGHFATLVEQSGNSQRKAHAHAAASSIPLCSDGQCSTWQLPPGANKACQSIRRGSCRQRSVEIAIAAPVFAPTDRDAHFSNMCVVAYLLFFGESAQCGCAHSGLLTVRRQDFLLPQHPHQLAWLSCSVRKQFSAM